MKNIFTSFLALLGLASACGQHNFENANVDRFAEYITDNNVVLLDVRTEKDGQTDVSGIPSQLENDRVEVRIRHYE